jgi:hypothetical protein
LQADFLIRKQKVCAVFFARFEIVYLFDGFFTLFAGKIKAPSGALCILYCSDIFLIKIQKLLFGKHRIDHAVKHMLIVIVQTELTLVCKAPNGASMAD